MDTEWVQGICNEKSGFLFSHACDRPARDECSQCGKPICSDHVHSHEEGIFCTTCVKSAMKAERQPGQRQYNSDRYDDRDPYFYSGYHYNGYGYYGPGYWGHHSYRSRSYGDDPHDFTEADGASMAYENDEGFESDMGES